MRNFITLLARTFYNKEIIFSEIKFITFYNVK